MTIFSNNSFQVLDPEQCWNDWISLGSLRKVRRKYQHEGLISSRTGETPNESAIQKAAYNYAINHIEEMKERFDYEYMKDGRIPTEDEWKKRLYRIGYLLFYQRKSRLQEFINKHGLQAYAQANNS